MTFGDYIDRERRESADEATLIAKIDDILDLLGDYGEIPEELIDKINAQHDKEALRILHKLAARVDSIEDFEEQMDEVLKNTMIPV